MEDFLLVSAVVDATGRHATRDTMSCFGCTDRNEGGLVVKHKWHKAEACVSATKTRAVSTATS